MSHSDDRREFSRVPVALEGRLVLADGRTIPGRLTELSVGGARFAARSPLGDEASVRVEVLAGDAESHTLLSAHGSLGRSDSDSRAIAFTGIDLESFEALRRLVLASPTTPSACNANSTSTSACAGARRCSRSPAARTLGG
ncbi:MAG: PilZ domain-containing protein [Planctomycetes bacterium]|nr:PilZ domain-containing protein [Planctomycetota bacterium]